MSHPIRVATRVCGILIVLVGAGASISGQAKPDREYTLVATVLGYRGAGGEIEGLRNPTLWAVAGETVRITIVNGELMVHDIALEKHSTKSPEILDKGASTSLTFKARESDTYYCSIPGHRLAGMEGRLDVSDSPRQPSEGIAPDSTGGALNLDFESGTLDGWKATGDAFAIVEGENGAPSTEKRRAHAGKYWVSSGVKGGSRKGSLTSRPFRARHPYASFLVSGGAFASTRVEVALAEGGEQVIYTISGTDSAMLRPAVVDLRPYAGKEIFVRLVDDDTGASTAAYIKENPWAHVNFDHFRFHDAKPFFPGELTPADISLMPPMDPIKHAGLSPAEAARAITVPKGFTVTLAASEPNVVRPVAFALDDRGRLWVAEAHTYPSRAEEGKGRDRILILEDTNGDGQLDSRKVFIENLNLVSGIEVGFGGVWVGAAPYLLFIPVKDGTDRPAGPAQTLLDGWGYQDTHETLNTFTWGPDGWLYGAHGVFTHSNVGKVGAGDADRQRLNAGIWRYHPTKHIFEVFAEGTSNPWGLDFNDYGHAFTTACVIEHLYHVIQGARYKRQAGQHFNPYTYDDIKTVADHVHWAGKRGPHAGNSRSDAVGGGHAHVGAMIYLGGDHWGAEYRNTILMNNIHGHRANGDRLTRKGSGYAATHGPDFLNANDSWSQMLNFRYGPDGSVHVIDWYDKNQCHSSNPEIHQKTLGRIFKIRHEKDRWTRVDLTKLSSEALVDLQLNRNEWYVRHARRLLQERGPDPRVHARLKRILQEQQDVTRQLRALWALHVTGGLSDEDHRALLGHANEYVRSWAITLIAEDKDAPAAAVQQFATMARTDQSPLVRLYLASALQRIPAEKRWDIVAGLMAHVEDASDHNLPLMVWYAAEPLVELDMSRALTLAAESKLPRLFSFAVQRIAATKKPEAIHLLAARLARTEDAGQQRDLINALGEFLKKD
jgi:putative membrane-bound dehydrogenase-like protein